MPTLPFHTTDVFTTTAFGGNPLAVFPDARGLNVAQMQATARELNLSETVFVFPPENPLHTRRLRIFTPAAELPFAGHPTVGTAIVLARIGEIALSSDETRIVFEEGVGPVPVTIRRTRGKAAFAQLSAAKMPEVGPPLPSAETLAAMLSLEPDEILQSPWKPAAVSCGVPFALVPVAGLDALGRARVDYALWQRHLASHPANEIFVYTPETPTPDVHFRARMFAPRLGIAEDPATGSAAAAFAGYLAMRQADDAGSFAWLLEQGVEMGRPSELHLEAEKRGGRVTAVRVGGAAVMMAQGTMAIPDLPGD